MPDQIEEFQRVRKAYEKAEIELESLTKSLDEDLKSIKEDLKNAGFSNREELLKSIKELEEEISKDLSAAMEIINATAGSNQQSF